MKHYELFKLVPGADPVAVQEKLWKCFRELDGANDWLNHPVIYRSCRPEDDYDLMAVVEITEEERIGGLVSDALAQKLEGRVQEFIQNRKTFNHY